MVSGIPTTALSKASKTTLSEYTFTLKMASAGFAETLSRFQHFDAPRLYNAV